MQEEEDSYVENIGDLDNPYHAIFTPARDNSSRGNGTHKPKQAIVNAQVLLRLQLDVRQDSHKEPSSGDLEVSRCLSCSPH
jgi:hypothetical protein